MTSLLRPCLVTLFTALTATTTSACTSESEDPANISSELATCPGPVRLQTSVKPSNVSDAERALHTERSPTSSWVKLASVALYSYPPCASSAEITDVEDSVRSAGELRGRQVLTTPSDVAGVTIFRGDAGTTLLHALDLWGGSAARDGVQRWDEVPCPNCTENLSVLIVRYAQSRRVAVISFRWGWDS